MDLTELQFGETPYLFDQLTYGASLSLAVVNPDTMAMPDDLLNSVESRRRAYVAGRLCAARALSLAGSIDLEVGRTRAGTPIWPTGFRGSITHTSAMAYAVASGAEPSARIGIDSEPLLSKRALTDVLLACCTPEEVFYLSSQPDPRLATTIAFSIKESFYKATSEIIERELCFRDIIVRSIDLSHQSIELHSTEHARFSRCFSRFTYDEHDVHTSVLLF